MQSLWLEPGCTGEVTGLYFCTDGKREFKRGRSEVMDYHGGDASWAELFTTESSVSASDVRLTPRQREVLGLLCEGLPNKLICRRLDISCGTVKAHIAVILRELGVSTRLQAVVEAQRLGLCREAEYS